ncbi:MAG: flavin reductase [Clostridia bacterium]
MFEKSEKVMQQLTKGAFLCSGENIMVIGWGFLGYMWKKEVFIAPIRKSRYTFDILNQTKSFTVSVPKEGEFEEEIKFCGSKSGREVDKWESLDLRKIPANHVDSYIVGGCEKYYECKVVAVIPMTKDMLGAKEQKFYEKDDNLHYLFVGEIVND